LDIISIKVGGLRYEITAINYEKKLLMSNPIIFMPFNSGSSHRGLKRVCLLFVIGKINSILVVFPMKTYFTHACPSGGMADTKDLKPLALWRNFNNLRLFGSLVTDY